MGKYKAPTIRNALPSTLPLLLSLSSSLPLFLFSSPSRATSPSPDERSSQENPHRCTVQTNKNRFDRVHKHGGRPAHLIARARFHDGLLHDARSPCIRYLYWRKCALNIQFAALLIGASILRMIFVVYFDTLTIARVEARNRSRWREKTIYTEIEEPKVLAPCKSCLPRAVAS